jgi:hypothetical protein
MHGFNFNFTGEASCIQKNSPPSTPLWINADFFLLSYDRPIKKCDPRPRRSLPAAAHKKHKSDITQFCSNTSIASMWETAVTANRQAVALLQHGDHVQAICLLQRSLKVIQRCVANFDDDAQDFADCNTQFPQKELLFSVSSRPDNGEDTSSASLGDRRSQLLHTVSVVTSEFTSNKTGVSASTNLFFLYSYAFVLDETTPNTRRRTQEPNQEILLYTFSTAVLLFNMALVFHLKGLASRTKSSSKTNIRKALRFYCMIPSLHDGQEDGNEGLPYILRCAIWNNTGHAYSYLQETDNAQRCKTYLSCALSEDTRWRATLSPAEYSFFCMSIISHMVRHWAIQN